MLQAADMAEEFLLSRPQEPFFLSVGLVETHRDYPEPGPGEVVVALRAAALNRRDLFGTYGQYPGVKQDILPKIPGSDGSGEVVARGDGAGGPGEGTEVVINPALFWGEDPRKPGK